MNYQEDEQENSKNGCDDLPLQFYENEEGYTESSMTVLSWTEEVTPSYATRANGALDEPS